MTTINYETNVTHRSIDMIANPTPMRAAELAHYIKLYLAHNPGWTRPALVQWHMASAITRRPVSDMGDRLAYDCIPALMAQMHEAGKLKRQRSIAPKGMSVGWEEWEYKL